MIKVTIVRSARTAKCLNVKDSAAAGRITSIRVEGHAGYAESGKDIVCAAVSVIAYTCAGAVAELADMGCCHTEQDGFLEVTLPDGCWDSEDQQRVMDIIAEAACIGFRQVEWNYPRHIKIDEVRGS